jgi:hypothetical protein
VTPGEGLRRPIQPVPNVRLRGGLRRARMSRPGRVRQIECTADRDRGCHSTAHTITLEPARHPARPPRAQYLQASCGDYGPADWTYYPFHGIFISVSLSPLHLGLHYPTGTTVELDSNEVTINGSRLGTSVHLIYQLTRTLHAALGSGAPWRLDAMADPMDPAGRYGYRRTTQGRDFAWANFSAREALIPAVPHDLGGATIGIPAMTINGKRTSSQELTITRKNYVGIIPVNC